jgi:hypothetical protein
MQKLVAWATITSLCIAAGTAMAVTGTASSPTSVGGVVPYLIAGEGENEGAAIAPVPRSVKPFSAIQTITSSAPNASTMMRMATSSSSRFH